MRCSPVQGYYIWFTGKTPLEETRRFYALQILLLINRISRVSAKNNLRENFLQVLRQSNEAYNVRAAL